MQQAAGLPLPLTFTSVGTQRAPAPPPLPLPSNEPFQGYAFLSGTLRDCRGPRPLQPPASSYLSLDHSL